MAKVSATTSLSPQSLTTGNGIYAEDVLAVSRAQNYAFAKCPEMLVSQCTGFFTGVAMYTHNATLIGVASGSFSTWYRINIWINADIDAILVSTTMFLAVGADASVRVTIGGWSATHSHTANGSSTITSSPATSSTGTGWQPCTIELRRDNVGDNTLQAALDSFYFEGVAVADGDIPAPVNE